MAYISPLLSKHIAPRILARAIALLGGSGGRHRRRFCVAHTSVASESMSVTWRQMKKASNGVENGGDKEEDDEEGML